ncbi:unnamed protein product, partial [marine sediment metagenome]
PVGGAKGHAAGRVIGPPEGAVLATRAVAEVGLVAEVYLALLTVHVGDAHSWILGWRRQVSVKCARL